MHVGPFGRVATMMAAGLCCAAQAAPAVQAGQPDPGAPGMPQFDVRCVDSGTIAPTPDMTLFAPLPDLALFAPLAAPAAMAPADAGQCAWRTTSARDRAAEQGATSTGEQASAVTEIDTYFMFLTGLGAIGLVSARSQRSSPWSATRVEPH